MKTKQIYAKIKETRILFKMSQKELAEKSGTAQEYISRIELNQVNISLELLTKIFEVLDIDLYAY